MLWLEQPQPQSIKKSLRKARWILKSITEWFLWVRRFQETTKYSNGGSFWATRNLRWSSKSKRWFKRRRVTLKNLCQTTLLLCIRTTITQHSTLISTKTLLLSPRSGDSTEMGASWCQLSLISSQVSSTSQTKVSILPLRCRNSNRNTMKTTKTSKTSRSKVEALI